MKYEDRDGDMISLETEMDFQDLLSTLGDVVVNDTVSIFVNKNEKQKDDSSNSNDNHKKNSGNGKNIRHFLSVHDFCRGLVLIIKKTKKGTFNIGSSEKFSNIQIAKKIQKIVGNLGLSYQNTYLLKTMI